MSDIVRAFMPVIEAQQAEEAEEAQQAEESGEAQRAEETEEGADNVKTITELFNEAYI